MISSRIDYTDMKGLHTHRDPDVLSGVTGNGLRFLGESLVREFSAPVGILDPDHRAWKILLGGEKDQFPELESRLLEVASSQGLRLGRVAIWRHDNDPERIWLLLPLPSAESADLVGFVGFLAPIPPGDLSPRPSATGPADSRKPIVLGPPCPDPALRAWGQQFVNRLQSNHETRVFPVQPTADDGEEGEHVVIGRLILRMKISDPPAKFQSLAANVLKTSMNMAAVAWVPNDTREPVVVCGEIEGLRSSSYRSFVPLVPRETAFVVNDLSQPPVGVSAPPLYRFASVPAGTAGWLVAVKPLLDRPIETPEIERMQYVASLIAAQSSNARSYGELKELLFGIIRALTAAIDAKDPNTSGHSERGGLLSAWRKSWRCLPRSGATSTSPGCCTMWARSVLTTRFSRSAGR